MARSDQGHGVFRFDGLVVDVSRREVRRDSRVVPLAPKPFDLLVLLLSHRERAVSRAEIHAAVWPDVRVSEATLASTLRDLRRALGDEGQRSRLIRTIRGIGLRFIAQVEQDFAPAERIFVGRGSMLGRLRAALAAASRGRGGVVLFSGEPGIGKTHLAEEFAREARATGAVVHFARCSESIARVPYRPWQELLRELVEALSAAQREADVGAGAAELARLVPELAPPSEPAAHEEAGVEAEAALFRLFDATASLLRRAAQRTALVLVFDDLDRADRPSLRLLEFAATELAAARILFIGLYRSCELAVEHPLAATLAELSRHPRFESHRLAGLAPEETRALVAARADGDPPPEVVETIQQRSEGNPFFACALADQWVERKLAGEVAGRVVPPSIRELVRGRLLRLPKPCREVLEAAAPIGREFPIDLLARVCGLEEEELLDALDQARRAGLVELLNGNAQRFVHALVQEVIYAELLPSLRRELHERVAEALDAEGGREHLGEIARHFALAAADSTGERAVESAVRAAEEAERRLAFADEPGLYELAVEALARVRPLDRVRRCDLLLALARACLRDREITQADHAAQRAAELARELGSPARLAQAALVLAEHVTVRSIDVVPILDEALAALPPDPTPLRARVLSQVSRHLLFSEQHERRQRLADEAVSIARAAADQVALAEALIAKRGVLAVPTRLAERLAVISEAVACADAAPGSACRVHARAWRAVDRLEAGDVEAADRDVEAVQRIAFDEGLLRFESLPPRWSAMQAVLQGRFRDAEQAIGEAYRAMWRARDPNALPCVAVQVTALLAEQGRWEPLEALLVQALGERRPGGLSRAASAFLAWLALERGRLEKARRRFDRAAADGFEALAQAPDFLAAASFLAEMCARYDEPGPAARLYSHLAPYADRIVVFEHALACRGSASYFLGLLARASGRLDEAACHLEAALAINAKLGAVPYVARTQLELARALRARARSGDLDQACALLRDAARVGARLGLRDLAGSASALMH